MALTNAPGDGAARPEDETSSSALVASPARIEIPDSAPLDDELLAPFGMEEHPTGGFHGLLEVIPTKADLVIDLIRANSLWPLLSGLSCCAIEMMSTATSPVPRFASSGRRSDRGRHADDEDGRPACSAVGADARAQVVRGDGHLHHVGRPLQALV